MLFKACDFMGLNMREFMYNNMPKVFGAYIILFAIGLFAENKRCLDLSAWLGIFAGVIWCLFVSYDKKSDTLTKLMKNTIPMLIVLLSILYLVGYIKLV